MRFVEYFSFLQALAYSLTFHYLVMESMIDQLASSICVHVRGSFLNPTDKTLTLSQLQPLPSERQDTAPVLTAQAESSENWNVAAILRGDGEF